MKVRLLAIAATFQLVASISLLWWYFHLSAEPNEWRRTESQYASEARWRTRTIIIETLTNDIFLYTTLKKSFPCQLTTMPTNIPATAMYSALSGMFDNMDAVYGLSGTNVTFLDSWHNELHFRVEEASTKMPDAVDIRLLIWSNGANGKDDGMQNDDIFVETLLQL